MTISNINRKKLINAVIFFTLNVKHINTTKLMKLLFFFDFDHFKQTGYPAIGLKYYTFKNGPVPKKFWVEFNNDSLPEDMKDKIGVRILSWGKDKFEREYFPQNNATVDFSVFSPREKKLLEKTAEIFRDSTATQMSEISHEEELPWEKTMREKGENQEIDYLLAIDDKSPFSREDAEEELNDYFAALKAFNLDPVE